MPAAAACAASARELVRRRREDAAVRPLPSIGSSSAAVREPSVPSAKSFSQPNDSRRRASRRRPSARAAPEAAGDRVVEAVGADAGADPDRQLAGARRARRTCRRPGSRDPGARKRGIVRADDAELEQLATERPIARAGRLRRRAAGRGRSTRPPAFSRRTPSGSPSSSRRITPPSGSGVDASMPAARERGVARPERVVVERAEGDEPARRDALEGVRGRPARPSGAGPSRRRGSSRAPRSARPPRGDPLERLLDRRRRREVDLLGGERGVDDVEVGVGQPGDRDLAGLELDPAGCAGRRGSRARSPCRRRRPCRRGSRRPRPSRSRSRPRTWRCDR